MKVLARVHDGLAEVQAAEAGQPQGVEGAVGSHDGEGGSPKIPLTRLSVAVATIATLVVVALVGWLGLGCGSMTGSRSGTTGIVDG